MGFTRGLVESDVCSSFKPLQKHSLDFVIDLHANSNLNGIFIQGNSYDSVFRNERHIVLPKMLAQNCPDFHSTNTVYNADLEKEGTARR